MISRTWRMDAAVPTRKMQPWLVGQNDAGQIFEQKQTPCALSRTA
jgi:hypothetical protein